MKELCKNYGKQQIANEMVKTQFEFCYFILTSTTLVWAPTTAYLITIADGL